MTMADSFWDMGSAWEDDGVMFCKMMMGMCLAQEDDVWEDDGEDVLTQEGCLGG